MAFGPLDGLPNSSVRHRVAKIPVPSPGLLSFSLPRRCPLCWWRETSNGTAPAAPTPGARRARKRGGDPRNGLGRFDAVIARPRLWSRPRVRPSAQLSFPTMPRVSPCRFLDRAGHRAGLALAARERHLCEVHGQRCGAVCVNWLSFSACASFFQSSASRDLCNDCYASTTNPADTANAVQRRV